MTKVITMKYNKIILLFSLLLGLIANAVQADGYQTDSYSFGIISAVYQDELRMVINDSSINFNSISNLRDQYGETILNISGELKKGVYVKFQSSPSSNSSSFLIGLQIISEQEFNQYQEEKRNNTH